MVKLVAAGLADHEFPIFGANHFGFSHRIWVSKKTSAVGSQFVHGDY